MHFDKFSFGSFHIDGSTYEHDIVIDRGAIRKRKKKPSKKLRDEFGHTPLSVEEDIEVHRRPSREANARILLAIPPK
jgi:hypothetical protein